MRIVTASELGRTHQSCQMSSAAPCATWSQLDRPVPDRSHSPLKARQWDPKGATSGVVGSWWDRNVFQIVGDAVLVNDDNLRVNSDAEYRTC